MISGRITSGDNIAGIVDLSVRDAVRYNHTQTLDAAQKARALSNIGAASDADLTTHANDNTRHIIADERTKWNDAIDDISAISEHTGRNNLVDVNDVEYDASNFRITNISEYDMTIETIGDESDNSNITIPLGSVASMAGQTIGFGLTLDTIQYSGPTGGSFFQLQLCATRTGASDRKLSYVVFEVDDQMPITKHQTYTVSDTDGLNLYLNVHMIRGILVGTKLKLTNIFANQNGSTEFDRDLTAKDEIARADLITHVTDTVKHVEAADKSTWNAKYNKPTAGIPKADLSSNVQVTLDSVAPHIADMIVHTSDAERAAVQEKIDHNAIDIKRLYALTRGQAWDTDEDVADGYSKAIPAGAHAVEVEKIGGRTVVWSQKVNGMACDNPPAGITATVSGDGIILNGTATENKSSTRLWASHKVTFVSGHKYFMRISENPYNRTWGYSGGSLTLSVKEFVAVSNASGTVYGAIAIQAGDVFDNVLLRTNVYDLTQMFGADVAATITTPEQAYALGVPRTFESYSAEELKSAEISKVNLTGRNLYDIDTYPLVAGYWVNANNGVYSSGDAGRAATPDFIPCDGWTTMVLNKRSSGSNTGIAFYSAAEQSAYISGVKSSYISPTYVIAIPPEAKYMRFTTVANDPEIMISRVASVPYSPYQHDEMVIPAAVRTQYPLRSARSAYDSYEWDGEKWRHHERVNIRAYQSADDTDPTVITDGTNTVYPLDTEVVTDITDLMTGVEPMMNCETGGSITFVQTDTALAIPNKETYFINLSEALEG